MDRWKKYNSFLLNTLETGKIPGAQICVMNEEGIVFEKNYGWRDEEHSQAVDSDTIFGIASMSKSITCFALSILESQGKICFDDPVYRYLPELRIPGTPREALLIRHLCTHTSGIPPIPTITWAGKWNTLDDPWQAEFNENVRSQSKYKMDKIEDIIDYLNAGEDFKPLGQPGEYMSYLNDGYALLSTIVDIVSGESLETFAQREIFDKLGMKHTTFDLERVRATGNYTKLFYHWNGKLCCSDIWENAGIYRGTGFVKSTARDMARYYRMLSQGGILDGVELYPRECVENLMGSEFPLMNKPVYCFGLSKRRFGNDILCSHTGGLKGVSSMGGFFAGKGFSVVVLTNMSEADRETMFYGACNLEQGNEPGAYWDWCKPSAETVENPGMYVGTYRSMEANIDSKVVLRDDGSLECQALGMRFDLVHAGGTSFMMVPHGSGLTYGKPITFMIRDGVSWGVTYGSRIFQRSDI